MLVRLLANRLLTFQGQQEIFLIFSFDGPGLGFMSSYLNSCICK